MILVVIFFEDGAVTFLNSSLFSLKLFLAMEAFAQDFLFWSSSWLFWLVAKSYVSPGRFMTAYVGLEFFK